MRVKSTRTQHKSALTEIDELIRPDHYYPEAEDKCGLPEYISITE
jgi:hypothetical protein